MSFNVHKLFSAAARNGVNYAFMLRVRREYLGPSRKYLLAAFDLWACSGASLDAPKLVAVGKAVVANCPRVRG